jgi:SAM-dependent methyltransferase
VRPAELRTKAEADFHNSAYQEGLRKSASSFYVLMENCSRSYRQFLKAHCAGKRVLEYGCGENSVAPFLMENQADSFVGIDISDVVIEQAKESAFRREKAGRIRYFVMNAEELDFEDNSFDLICGIAILHHLDLDKAYRELARTLTPDGAAIFLEPLGHNPVINLYRRLTPHLRTQDEHPLLMTDIKAAESHFGHVEIRSYNLFSLLSLACSSTPVFPEVRRFFNAVDEAVFATMPLARRYAWTTSMILTAPRKQCTNGSGGRRIEG